MASPSNPNRPELFGTDGIRAPFGTPPLDEATVGRLGDALAAQLRSAGGRPHVVLGGDTRDSTPVLCGWLGRSLARHGLELTYLGTVPTPAVAALTRSLGAACGIAVSASHNRHPDNGIKLIDGAGFKWSPAAELRLEERLAQTPRANGGRPPVLEQDLDAVRSYLDGLAATLPDGQPLAGTAVAIDAGHGAASPYAGELFERLGARVTVRCAEPDGRNINAGSGSTHPEGVAELTRRSGSDLGFAFDGDADRVIVADESGEIRDGDATLYLWARDLQRRGRLAKDAIVATSMSNLGLEVALARAGIALVRCGVGDRKVVRTMQREGIELGGEQSGHIVNLALATQGDGMLTALQIARLQRADGRPLSAMLAGFERFPQLLQNVPVRDKPDFESLPRVVAARDSVLARLGDRGRLVLRYSGTEPLARVMIEGPDGAEVEALAGELAGVIAEEIG